MSAEAGVVAGEGIGHGVGRQVEGIGRVARALADVARAAAQAQAVAAEELAEFVDRRQRRGVARHVLQALALQGRVLGDFRGEPGVAADQAPAFAELAGEVQLQAARADPAGGAHAAVAGTVEFVDQHVLLADVEQRQGAAETPRHIQLGAQLPGGRLLRQDRRIDGLAGAQRGDGRVRLERARVAAVQRNLVAQAVDQAAARHPFLPVDVGVGVERPAAPGELVVDLVARAADQDPAFVQVDRVLEVQRVAAQLVGLVAVAGDHPGRRHHLAIDRVEVVEAAGLAVAQQVGAEDLALLVVHAELQVMLHPGQLQRSAQAEGGEAVAADRAVGAVHAPGQGAVGIHGHHPGLVVVVGLATVAVAEVGLPGVVELPFEIQAGQLGTALGDVEGLVQAPAARDVQRAVGTRVDGRATVERRGELAVLVAQVDRRVLAVPGQRGRHQRLATLAEVAPVILVLMIEDHPVGQSAVAQRAGGVELAAAAVAPVGVGRATQGQGVGLLQLRLLAHHVDHPARVLDAIEQGCRPLQHLDVVGGGGEIAALHRGHAVAHDRAVAVVAEAAFHHRVLGTAEGVGLGDAADVAQRVVKVARALVLQRLCRDHADRLGDFQ